MKTIKKILVVCFLTLGVISASAQSTTWGIKAGLNVSSVDGVSYAKYVPGFHLGVVGQFLLVEGGDAPGTGFGIETGIGYSMLSNKVKTGASTGERNRVVKNPGTYHSSYIQMPIKAFYKFSAGDNLFLYPTAGVYFAYGIGGSDDYFDSFQRFDVGIDLGLNMQYDHFTVGVAWERGLSKVWENQKAYNNNAMVSLGYMF